MKGSWKSLRIEATGKIYMPRQSARRMLPELGKLGKELHLEVREANEVHAETEGVAKEHMLSPIITMASIPEPSL